MAAGETGLELAYVVMRWVADSKPDDAARGDTGGLFAVVAEKDGMAGTPRMLARGDAKAVVACDSASDAACNDETAPAAWRREVVRRAVCASRLRRRAIAASSRADARSRAWQQGPGPHAKKDTCPNQCPNQKTTKKKYSEPGVAMEAGQRTSSSSRWRRAASTFACCATTWSCRRSCSCVVLLAVGCMKDGGSRRAAAPLVVAVAGRDGTVVRPMPEAGANVEAEAEAGRVAGASGLRVAAEPARRDAPGGGGGGGGGGEARGVGEEVRGAVLINAHEGLLGEVRGSADVCKPHNYS